MNNLIYSELRNCNNYIRSIEDKDVREKEDLLLILTVEKIYKLANIARKEGLLALEEAESEMDTVKGQKHLSNMVLLVVDGTAPAIIEEISLSRYFALGLKGYEALNYLLMLVGVLSIQEFENPLIVEERLLSFLPENVESLYRQTLKERHNNILKNYDK